MSNASDTFSHKRMTNEFRTICAMLEIYCRAHHETSARELCAECRELKEYARKRLLNCPFQEEKPTCGNCTVHCYKKSMRDKVKEVMRYSGPRMTFRHPIMAIRHLLDSRRKPQKLQKQ